jgi:hypothetical protein
MRFRIFGTVSLEIVSRTRQVSFTFAVCNVDKSADVSIRYPQLKIRWYNNCKCLLAQDWTIGIPHSSF